MSLYYYEKSKPKIDKEKLKQKKKPLRKNMLTVAAALDRIIQSISSKITKVRPLSFAIPLVFIVSGLSLLYGQLKPYAVHFLQAKFSDKLNQEIKPLVPESYEALRASYIFDPGAEYFDHILQDKSQSEETQNYKGVFHLTIESARINHVQVTANVDSTSEKTYQEALGNGLAHFKGTCLPGQGCNIFIFGHSAAGDYAQKHPEDPVTSFTRLFDLNIGDAIVIEFEGKNYNYVVKKIKEINPEDLDILSNPQPKSLSLMTCSPPGLNSKRLIVTAIEQ
jgi:LPXTG-site transpeptidase (sortase) family protein